MDQVLQSLGCTVCILDNTLIPACFMDEHLALLDVITGVLIIQELLSSRGSRALTVQYWHDLNPTENMADAAQL